VTAPLALYVHWPYCARICPYCDFNVVRARGRDEEAAALVRAILSDLRGQAERLGPRRLVSVFFGGGTPSLMPPDAAAEIVAAAKTLFEPAPDLEVTLEANPTDAEAARFAGFAAAGVVRLSLGVQALDDDGLAFLGRNHDAAEARRAAETARSVFPRLSIDLIYARPGQTPEAWARELGAALDLGPEHVSPYQLTLEPGTAMARAADRRRFEPCDAETAADLYDTTQAVLEAAGFEAYEVSNHARGEAARSRHNLAVWRGAEYLGVGPGAHGRLVLDGRRTATRAAARIQDYVARVESAGSSVELESLDPRAAAEERLMLGLRIAEGVGLSEVAALGLHPEQAPFAPLVEAGLVSTCAARLAATAAGRLVLDRVIAELVTGSL
jgi:putative oxygen-independent coproporphyrinogen III oxidase